MSSDYKIKISEQRAAELRRQAEEIGVTVNTMIAKTVEDAPPPTLDAAAAVFLAQLTDEHRKLILDCAQETGRTPAAYILSYIMRAHDQGATAVPIAETLEEARITPLPVGNATKRCEWCHQPFQADRPDQRYCPPPLDGESCGRQAGLDAVRKARKGAISPGIIPAPHIVEHVVKV